MDAAQSLRSLEAPLPAKPGNPGFATGFYSILVRKEFRCGFREPRIERLRRQIHTVPQAVDKDVEHREPRIILVVRRDEIPGRVVGRGFLHHILNRLGVLFPAVAIAKILIREFPALQGIGEPVLEPLGLLFGCDMEEDLRDMRPVVDECALEVVDLAIGALPFRLGGEPFDALHQHAAVPRPVEDNDLTLVGQPLPEALHIMLHLLMGRRRGDGMHLEASRVERPAEPPHHATLPCRVTALESDNRVLLRAEIGLLDQLQLRLQRLYFSLIFVEVHSREMVDGRERWTLRNEIFVSVHDCRHPSVASRELASGRTSRVLKNDVAYGSTSSP